MSPRKAATAEMIATAGDDVPDTQQLEAQFRDLLLRNRGAGNDELPQAGHRRN